MVSMILSIARPVAQLALQGVAGATAAQVSFHAYLKHVQPHLNTSREEASALPQKASQEQRLNAWAFTLIASCAVGAAVGVSATALFIGVAIHTLIFIKESAALSQQKPPQELLKFDNFPYYLPRLTHDAPLGVVCLSNLSLPGCPAQPFRWGEERLESVHLYTFVEVEGNKVPVPLGFDRENITAYGHKLTGEIQADGTYKIDLSPELALHLAVTTKYNSSPLDTTFEWIPRAPSSDEMRSPPHYQITGEGLFVNRSSTYSSSNITWTSAPDCGGYSKVNTTLNEIPNRLRDEVFLFTGEDLFRVSFAEAFDTLCLRDVWGRWQKAAKEGMTEFPIEDIKDRLGFSALPLLNALEKADGEAPFGRVHTTEKGSVAVDLEVDGEREKFHLSPSSAYPLLFRSDTPKSSIEARLIAKNGHLIVHPDDQIALAQQRRGHLEKAA